MTTADEDTWSVVKLAKEQIVKYVDKDFDDTYTWSIYFLIDIKVVYIISFAYITIVNLISSTASLEATDDKHSNISFQISSTERGLVMEISDDVLWNCRPHSASEYYYKFLYWMLLVGLISALSGFFVTKLITLINIGILSPEHGLTRLWHIAVFRYHPNDKTQSECIVHGDSKKKLKKIPIEVFNEVKGTCTNFWRTACLFFILLLLVAGMFVAYLSYDIHPLACIRRSDTSIQYHADKKRVDINMSSSLKNFQLAGGATILVIALLIFAFAGLFYYCSNRIIKDMERWIGGSGKTCIRFRTQNSN